MIKKIEPRKPTRLQLELRLFFRRRRSALRQMNIFPFIENKATLEYDFSEEKKFSYRNLSMDEMKNGIHETTEFLELFLRNFLLNEAHPLHNRSLHISGIFRTSKKANIDDPKANIERAKVNIKNAFTAKTASHVCKLLDKFGFQTIFGRSDVQKTQKLTALLAMHVLTCLIFCLPWFYAAGIFIIPFLPLLFLLFQEFCASVTKR